MYSNNSNGSRAAWARGFAALWATLAMGLGMLASPAAAAPFAYVKNRGSNSTSVIDTATNTVVATVPTGIFLPDGLPLSPAKVAVAPDGKHAYVIANTFAPGDMAFQVIDTASNTVMATVPFGGVIASLGSQSARMGIRLCHD